MPRPKAKRPRGRPPSEAPKMTNRYSVNYSDDENAAVEAAARADGDPFVGRWIGKAALAKARETVEAKKNGR